MDANEYKNLHNPFKYDNPPVQEGTDKKMETPEERRKRKALAESLRNPVLIEEVKPPAPQYGKRA